MKSWVRSFFGEIQRSEAARAPSARDDRGDRSWPSLSSVPSSLQGSGIARFSSAINTMPVKNGTVESQESRQRW
jgi:hypothetical protein